MPMIELTIAEHAALAATVSRLVEIRKELSEREWKKGTNKILRQLAAKIAAHTPSVICDRPQLRFLEAVLANKYKVLDEAVIPEYSRREPASERLTQAANLREVTGSLLAKVRKAL
jgi:hypothetical protein